MTYKKYKDRDSLVRLDGKVDSTNFKNNFFDDSYFPDSKNFQNTIVLDDTPYSASISIDITASKIADDSQVSGFMRIVGQSGSSGVVYRFDSKFGDVTETADRYFLTQSNYSFKEDSCLSGTKTVIYDAGAFKRSAYFSTLLTSTVYLPWNCGIFFTGTNEQTGTFFIRSKLFSTSSLASFSQIAGTAVYTSSYFATILTRSLGSGFNWTTSYSRYEQDSLSERDVFTIARHATSASIANCVVDIVDLRKMSGSDAVFITGSSPVAQIFTASSVVTSFSSISYQTSSLNLDTALVINQTSEAVPVLISCISSNVNNNSGLDGLSTFIFSNSLSGSGIDNTGMIFSQTYFSSKATAKSYVSSNRSIMPTGRNSIAVWWQETISIKNVYKTKFTLNGITASFKTADQLSPERVSITANGVVPQIFYDPLFNTDISIYKSNLYSPNDVYRSNDIVIFTENAVSIDSLQITGSANLKFDRYDTNAPFNTKSSSSIDVCATSPLYDSSHFKIRNNFLSGTVFNDFKVVSKIPTSYSRFFSIPENSRNTLNVLINKNFDRNNTKNIIKNKSANYNSNSKFKHIENSKYISNFDNKLYNKNYGYDDKKFIDLELNFYTFSESINFSTGSNGTRSARYIMSDIKTDSLGNMYACGYGQQIYTGTFITGLADSAFILKSTDNGVSWQRSDNSGSLWNSLYVDSNNNVYAAGRNNNGYWTVRKYFTVSSGSIASGTWSTIDTYTALTGNAESIAKDRFGNVVVAGQLVNGTSAEGTLAVRQIKEASDQSIVFLYNTVGGGIKHAKLMVEHDSYTFGDRERNLFALTTFLSSSTAPVAAANTSAQPKYLRMYTGSAGSILANSNTGSVTYSEVNLYSDTGTAIANTKGHVTSRNYIKKNVNFSTINAKIINDIYFDSIVSALNYRDNNGVNHSFVYTFDADDGVGYFAQTERNVYKISDVLSGSGPVGYFIDALAGDNDKIFTVPAGIFLTSSHLYNNFYGLRYTKKPGYDNTALANSLTSSFNWLFYKPLGFTSSVAPGFSSTFTLPSSALLKGDNLFVAGCFSGALQTTDPDYSGSINTARIYKYDLNSRQKEIYINAYNNIPAYYELLAEAKDLTRGTTLADNSLGLFLSGSTMDINIGFVIVTGTNDAHYIHSLNKTQRSGALYSLKENYVNSFDSLQTRTLQMGSDSAMTSRVMYFSQSYYLNDYIVQSQNDDGTFSCSVTFPGISNLYRFNLSDLSNIKFGIYLETGSLTLRNFKVKFKQAVTSEVYEKLFKVNGIDASEYAFPLAKRID